MSGYALACRPKVRNDDPTSRVLLAHYAKHVRTDSADEIAELLLNVMFLRNTMSKEIIKLCASGAVPWLRLQAGRIAEESKEGADNTFLALQGRVFFKFVEPMRGWAKAPRRGWSTDLKKTRLVQGAPPRLVRACQRTRVLRVAGPIARGDLAHGRRADHRPGFG